jgi:hypothetical protein
MAKSSRNFFSRPSSDNNLNNPIFQVNQRKSLYKPNFSRYIDVSTQAYPIAPSQITTTSTTTTTTTQPVTTSITTSISTQPVTTSTTTTTTTQPVTTSTTTTTTTNAPLNTVYMTFDIY